VSGETENQVSGWTVDTLNGHVSRILQERDHRYEQRFKAQEAASNQQLKAHQEATTLAEENAQRWRENANEWRASMNDRESKFMPRTEALSISERLTEYINGQNERLTERERPNFPLLIAAFAVALTVISGGFYIVQLSTANVVAPVTAMARVSVEDRKQIHRLIQNLQRTQSGANAKLSELNAITQTSLLDREQIRKRIENNTKILSNIISRSNSQDAIIKQKLVEVETQFRGTGHLFNLQSAWQSRISGMLWKKIFDNAYPEFEFYPNMAQPQPQ
jgi:hypothetical protein